MKRITLITTAITFLFGCEEFNPVERVELARREHVELPTDQKIPTTLKSDAEEEVKPSECEQLQPYFARPHPDWTWPNSEDLLTTCETLSHQAWPPLVHVKVYELSVAHRSADLFKLIDGKDFVALMHQRGDEFFFMPLPYTTDTFFAQAVASIARCISNAVKVDDTLNMFAVKNECGEAKFEVIGLHKPVLKGQALAAATLYSTLIKPAPARYEGELKLSDSERTERVAHMGSLGSSDDFQKYVEQLYTIGIDANDPIWFDVEKIMRERDLVRSRLKLYEIQNKSQFPQKRHQTYPRSRFIRLCEELRDTSCAMSGHLELGPFLCRSKYCRIVELPASMQAFSELVPLLLLGHLLMAEVEQGETMRFARSRSENELAILEKILEPWSLDSNIDPALRFIAVSSVKAKPEVVETIASTSPIFRWLADHAMEPVTPPGESPLQRFIWEKWNPTYD